MKKMFLMAIVAMLAVSVQAQEVEDHPQPNKVPAYRGMRVRTQPDGYALRTYTRGDERHHWHMTEDGWQTCDDQKGWVKYAKMNRKGEIVPHWRKARNVEDRSKCAKRWLDKHGIRKMIP